MRAGRHSRWCTKSVLWLLTTAPKNILYTQTSLLQYPVLAISMHTSYAFEGCWIAVDLDHASPSLAFVVNLHSVTRSQYSIVRSLSKHMPKNT